MRNKAFYETAFRVWGRKYNLDEVRALEALLSSHSGDAPAKLEGLIEQGWEPED